MEAFDEHDDPVDEGLEQPRQKLGRGRRGQEWRAWPPTAWHLARSDSERDEMPPSQRPWAWAGGGCVGGKRAEGENDGVGNKGEERDGDKV